MNDHKLWKIVVIAQEQPPSPGQTCSVAMETDFVWRLKAAYETLPFHGHVTDKYVNSWSFLDNIPEQKQHSSEHPGAHSVQPIQAVWVQHLSVACFRLEHLGLITDLHVQSLMAQPIKKVQSGCFTPTGLDSQEDRWAQIHQYHLSQAKELDGLGLVHHRAPRFSTAALKL